MKVSEKTNVSMPIKNMIGIVVAVAMGVFAYTEVTARLTSLEKIETRIEDMMHNKVNIQFLQKQVEKALTDIETLKDKVRANGNGGH